MVSQARPSHTQPAGSLYRLLKLFIIEYIVLDDNVVNTKAKTQISIARLRHILLSNIYLHFFFGHMMCAISLANFDLIGSDV